MRVAVSGETGCQDRMETALRLPLSELDRWVHAPISGGSIENGIAPNRLSGQTVRHIAIKPPSGFAESLCHPLHIDASVPGFLTVCWTGGVKTFEIVSAVPRASR